ncbi:MAG: diphthamide synthesis protein [Nanoarchaeota archaeon]|nr:diphthamide synthesis protein [Nanoarchaeota archaeon]
MKTLFIPAKIKSNVNEKAIDEISKKLPKNLAIVYSIQYQDAAKEIKEILSSNGNHEITSFLQVLGCSKPNFQKSTKAILLIGSGRFHAVSLAMETNLPVYVLYNNSMSEISDKEIESLKTKKKAAYLKFLNSENVGILVSTKPGQENLKRALELKKSSIMKNKKAYILIGNNLSPSEFENFNLGSWVNTACPRLDFDASVVNMGDISKKR